MNSRISILVCILSVSITVNAQQRNKKSSYQVIYTQRIERVLSLLDSNNKPLKNIYDSSGAAYSITNIVNEAVLRKSVSVYETNNDAMILMDSSKIMKLVSYTSSGTKPSLAIDNIVITEYWTIDDSVGRMVRDYKCFLLNTYKDIKSAETIPLYKLSAEDFINMCTPYYIVVGNNKIPLTTYFNNRLYKSDIISVKRINTKSSGDSVPPIPDAVLEEMLNR